MIRLNDAGQNYLREKLLDHGHPVVIDNLDESFEHWVWQCNYLKSHSSPSEDCALELSAKNTNNGCPYLIRLHDDFFDFGTLKRLSDATAIRQATFSERYESDQAAEHDNGVGAFKAEVDGQMITVYVHS